MTTSDIIPIFVVLVLGLVALTTVAGWFAGWERRVLGLSFAAHVAATFAQIFVVLSVYGVGDMVSYHNVGMQLSDAIRGDPLGVTPEVFKVLLQQPYHLSFYVPGDGAATGSMSALSGLVGVFLGDSLYAINLFFALVSFFGKVWLYHVLKRTMASEHQQWLSIGVLLVPSTVFWSSGLVKESIAMAGLGPFLYGLAEVVSGRWNRGLVFLALGALPVLIIKPYILMVMLGASATWFYWQRSVSRGVVEFRPFVLLAGAAVAVVGVLVVGEINPRFSLERLADETGRLQSAGMNGKGRGGSMYAIGTGSRSLSGQLLYAPLGLLTALYRPSLLEASNPQMLASALETTAFLVTSVIVASRRGSRQLWETAVRYPILGFFVPFVVVLGIATGLTSANLGTLSRYRMPIVPFFAATLVLFWFPVQEARRAGSVPLSASNRRPPAWLPPPGRPQPAGRR